MRNFCRVVGLFLLVIMVGSCATPKAYEVSWPEAQSTLGGKKAVVLNYEMAERALAKSFGASMGVSDANLILGKKPPVGVVYPPAGVVYAAY